MGAAPATGFSGKRLRNSRTYWQPTGTNPVPKILERAI
jgi:hypothetical protein